MFKARSADQTLPGDQDEGQVDSARHSTEQSFVYVCQTGGRGSDVAGSEYPKTLMTSHGPSVDDVLPEKEADDQLTGDFSGDESTREQWPSWRRLVPSTTLDLLPRADRALFDYFQHQLTKSISCHEGMQVEICSALLPIAMQSRPMLAAVLCTAACHRLSVGLEQAEDKVLRLRNVALQHLNLSLATTDEAVLLSALGTSLALCLSDIASPSAADASWHLHLAGASALLRKLSDLKRPLAMPDVRLLVRLYISFKSIAESCGKRVQIGAELFVPAPLSEEEPGYIDDLAGFSTSLNPVIQAMHGIDETREQEARVPREETNSFSYVFLHAARSTHQYARLICQVEDMLQKNTPVFRSDIGESLTETSRRDFVKLDEAYHHMVLLQLYSRVDPDQLYFHESVKASLRHIMDCISAMGIAARPCPAVAFLPPLFEAGYWVTSQTDQQRLRDLLFRIRACYGMGNVTCALDYLEDEWAAAYLNEAAGARASKSSRALHFLPY